MQCRFAVYFGTLSTRSGGGNVTAAVQQYRSYSTIIRLFFLLTYSTVQYSAFSTVHSLQCIQYSVFSSAFQYSTVQYSAFSPCSLFFMFKVHSEARRIRTRSIWIRIFRSRTGLSEAQSGAFGAGCRKKM